MPTIPAKLRVRARRDTAAFYLSELARGVLAGEVTFVAGEQRTSVATTVFPEGDLSLEEAGPRPRGGRPGRPMRRRLLAGGSSRPVDDYVRAGDRYERALPPPAALELALAAAKHFGLFFTGADLMETPDGGFVLLEVSAFGGFRLSVACGIDAAPPLAKVVMRRVRDVW